MKKILILANSDSAIYKFRMELIEELSKKYKIGIGIPYGKYMKEIRRPEYEFFNIPVDRHSLNPMKDIALMNTYKKVICKFRPDYVLTYTIKPNIYASIVCARYHIPVLCNITGLGVASKKGLLQKFLICLYRYSMKNVNTIFFQNKSNKKFFINHRIGKPSQYIMLPGSGVNTSKFQLEAYPNNEIIKFAFIARIIKEKGIDEYLEVAKRFHDEGLYAEFHICGQCEQDYIDKLNDSENNGYSIYHGLVKDMTLFYKNVDCVVLPSYYPEGQSNVLLEAASTGRPIITTNHPGCREAVDDQISGYLVRKKDANDLYDKMKMIYQKSIDEREQMGLKGRKKMEKEFDRKIVISKYLLRLDKE